LPSSLNLYKKKPTKNVSNRPLLVILRYYLFAPEANQKQHCRWKVVACRRVLGFAVNIRVYTVSFREGYWRL
jgi:hypothetical protein